MAPRGMRPIDQMSLFAAFGIENRVSLQDSAAPAAFAAALADRVTGAIDQATLLQGLRVEAMFEALVVSLGQYTLLKAEDQGAWHADSDYRAPDFRIVLKDGGHWLVEVKNVFVDDAFAQRRTLMKPEYLAAMKSYASLTGAELKLAVYWAKWSMWTLVSPDHFVDPNGSVTVDMMGAFSVSEMGRLGDRLVSTKAPLTLRLTMDPKGTEPIGRDGQVVATIGSAEVFCGETLLTTDRDQSLAWFFMQYGQWEPSEPEAVVRKDRLEASIQIWKPLEPTDNGFDLVGPLSRMFSRYYSEQTLDDGKVVQLFAPPRPEWLRPLVDVQQHDGPLPLWTFTIEPRANPLGPPVS